VGRAVGPDDSRAEGSQRLGQFGCILSDGQTLASGAYDKTVLLWDVQTGQVIRKLKGHKGWVSSVAFSADGQMLASGAYDETVQLGRKRAR
jgi:WD40 repeat protein